MKALPIRQLGLRCASLGKAGWATVSEPADLISKPLHLEAAGYELCATKYKWFVTVCATVRLLRATLLPEGHTTLDIFPGPKRIPFARAPDYGK